MLRIVGVERSVEPDREFVLLQNQGGLKVALRGYLLTDQGALERHAGSPDSDRMFAFSEDVAIPPSFYVMLVTGRGANGWRRSLDGSMVFYVYWNRAQPVWSQQDSALHLLSVVHTLRPKVERLSVSR